MGIKVGDILKYKTWDWKKSYEYTLQVQEIDIDWRFSPSPNAKIWVKRIDIDTDKVFHIRYSKYVRGLENGSIELERSSFFVRRTPIKKHCL